MNYIEISVSPDDKNLVDVLIAEFAAIGFESFEETEGALLAYISADIYKEQDVVEIAVRYNVVHAVRIIEPQNWNATWEKDFQPVNVEGFCTIRADFHPTDPNVEHDIIVTPKMSFGTGHHATTQLMIQQMRVTDISGKTVLDFGTGTGVLAILAKRLGATNITAIDTDEWSYENTIENMERNGTTGIEVKHGSLEVVSGNKYDVILANINRHILLQYMAEMTAMLNKEGIIIMSGILVEDVGVITASAQKEGLSLINTLSKDNWLSLSFVTGK